MANDDISRIVIKIGAKKTEDKKKNLRVEGLNNIHPIYEAVIALYKKYLSDSYVFNRFKINEKLNEDILRTVFATDALLDKLSDSQRKQVEGMFVSGSSLDEIVDMAALQITEDKRTKDGKVLYSTSEHGGWDKYFMKSLSYSPPSCIYFQSSELDNIKSRAYIMRKKRKTRTIITASLGALLLLCGIIFKNYYDITITRKKPAEKQETSLEIEKNKY